MEQLRAFREPADDAQSQGSGLSGVAAGEGERRTVGDKIPQVGCDYPRAAFSRLSLLKFVLESAGAFKRA